MDVGLEGEWFKGGKESAKWQNVTVPHTWQVMDGLEDYRGIAWYAKKVSVENIGSDNLLKLEFDAVHRDVQVWVDGSFCTGQVEAELNRVFCVRDKHKGPCISFVKI